MSTHTDSMALFGANTKGSRKQAKRARRARESRDLELTQLVGRGDHEATHALAERMAPRVERITRALMGASLDADEAALHALVEVLRSQGSYRGKEPLERWGDRTIALSVVRFARAVNLRSGPCDTQALPRSVPERRVDERSARTFEQYLQTLSEPARQTLLLRHALGFKIVELADALHGSVEAAREQLKLARNELRSLVRRRDGQPAALSANAERWCELRDREALGQPLRTDELSELSDLEKRDPTIWALVAQVRALELYFETTRGAAAKLQDSTLVTRAVAALRVTTPLPSTTDLSEPYTAKKPRDLDGSPAVRWLALGASIVLSLATVYALMVYRPPPPRPSTLPAADSSAAGVVAATALRPTVEALPHVTTAARGGKLRREGRLLVPGTMIGQGDSVETVDRPGCLQIEPGTEVCLALASSARLVSLTAQKHTVELSRGRLVVRIGAQAEHTQTIVRVGELEVRAARAVFAVERTVDGQQARVRSLRGELSLHAGEQELTITDGKGALFRAPGMLSPAPLVPALAQRDWDVLATGLHPPAAKPPARVEETRAAMPQLGEPASDSESTQAEPPATPAPLDPLDLLDNAAPAGAPL